MMAASCWQKMQFNYLDRHINTLTNGTLLLFRWLGHVLPVVEVS